MLPLHSRIPFGPANEPRLQQPWPFPLPSPISVDWLSSNFLPYQQGKLREVTAAIAEATRKIETIRKDASTPVTIGTMKNGFLHRTEEEQLLLKKVERQAQRQVNHRILEIGAELDKVVPEILKHMHRMAQSAQTLSARYFDKLSCLSRFSAGLGKLELAALKADFAVLVRDAAPVELARMAQNAIDDASPQSIVLLDVLRRENFRRVKKDDKAFSNPELLALIPVVEFNTAQPLLQQVVDIHNTALTEWLTFSNQTRRATHLRMAGELGALKLKENTVPIHG